MSTSLKANKLNLLNVRSTPIRTFWITSIAFFICFFTWFGVAPFMPDVVKDLGLTPSQKWNSIILAVTGTVFARLLIGKLCDKYGLRISYTYLLKKVEKMPTLKKDEASFTSILKDYSVWILFMVYAACFGMELTVYGTMDNYLQNRFGLKRSTAGNLVLSFALMNIFARTLGGYFGDKFEKLKDLRGGVIFLAVILAIESIVLSIFSTTTSLAVGILFLVAFSLSVQMAEGATFSVILINKK